MKVNEFFEMVRWNEYHNIRLKCTKSDCILTEFNDEVPTKYADMQIKGFATDWYEKIYILWI